MIAALVSLALLTAPIQEQQSTVQSADRPFVELVFLITGPNKDELKDEDRAKRTSAHLTGLRKMLEAGRAFAAGPIVGGGNREGLAIVNAASDEEAKKLFVDDPWVEINKLAVESHKWMVPVKRFGKAGGFMDLNTHAFAMISLPKDATVDAERETALVTRFKENPAVALIGLMDAGDTMRAVIIFQDKDKGMAANILAADPDIKSGKFTAILAQTYIQQGVLD